MATPPLPDLAERTRELLRPWFRERQFSTGDLLWREGETIGLLVAIRTGHVKVYRLLPTGRTVTLFVFGPGDVFGFLPFLDGEPYPAYAQAVDQVAADAMSRADLVEAVRSHPDVAMALISLLGRRLREAFDRIENQSTPGVLARVASAILALVPPDTASGTAVLVELPVSALEFAAAIGVSPETLSRSVSKLAADGVVHRIGSGRLQVLDVEGLVRATKPSQG
jgi:CRP-like cAMP-binding protein